MPVREWEPRSASPTTASATGTAENHETTSQLRQLSIHRDKRDPRMDQPKVLVVDDDEVIHTLMRYCLDGEPYTVLDALDGQRALEIADQEMPDLILLDVMMPGLDGMAVLRLLKTQDRTRRIPVIMFTALNQEWQISEFLDAGAIDHIGKPFTALVLRARVRATLRNRHQPATTCVA
jgi:DNA-binding response OmpR family regulator